MALLWSEMDTAQLFERSLSSFWGEILPGPPYAHGNFVEPRLDFLGLGGYVPVPEALN